MIIKWGKGKGIQITTTCKFLSFTAVFTQSKAHLLDGIDKNALFNIKHPINVLSQRKVFCARTQIPEEIQLSGFYECFFQNLQMKSVK